MIHRRWGIVSCFWTLLVARYGILGETTGPSHGRIVVCYVGTWAVYRPGRGSFAIENLEPSLCTHIIYSFASLNTQEDAIRSLDPWQDLKENYGKGGYERITNLRLRYPHLKVSLAIGGWNEGSTNYSKMAAEPARRSRFVASAVDFIKKYQFDGLDLDWEFPAKRGGAPEDKQNFLLLVKELRAAFRKHNLLLTAAFGAGKDTIDVAYDVEGLAVYLDFIHMMCYDYHGAWDQKTGANAPLTSTDVLSVEYSINYMLKLGAPAKKLVMGVPLYGRTFVLPEEPQLRRKPKLDMIATNVGFQGPFTRENGFMGYNEICLEIRNKTAPWKKYWDSASETPFLVREKQVIAYDDESAISKKVRFAMEKNLAGIMVWSIDTDDFQGDCADGEEDMNYPLMRVINKSIQVALDDIKNRIIDEKIDHKTNTGSVTFSSTITLFSVLVTILIRNM
ncbi:chitinase 2 [Rhynchophorus ferrugineus]|uniref:chitinase 2 n=1 Tax=Rhynchophorus ferrugineus TaxID=354439 RepID=UPI003FCCFB4F